MADPILYSFRRCPYAMRARMALHVSATPVEHREVLLRDKPAAMLEVSPKGTVPVLMQPDGTVLEESLDIMRWALGRSDPEGWLKRDDPALLDAIDGPFKHHLDRYKYASRHGSDPLEHRTGCMAILADFEARLQQADYLCGGRRGLADIATFPFVRQFAQTDRAWFDEQPLPRVQRWFAALAGSELFEAVMVKHPRWVPDEAVR